VIPFAENTFFGSELLNHRSSSLRRTLVLHGIIELFITLYHLIIYRLILVPSPRGEGCHKTLLFYNLYSITFYMLEKSCRPLRDCPPLLADVLQLYAFAEYTSICTRVRRNNASFKFSSLVPKNPAHRENPTNLRSIFP